MARALVCLSACDRRYSSDVMGISARRLIVERAGPCPVGQYVDGIAWGAAQPFLRC